MTTEVRPAHAGRFASLLSFVLGFAAAAALAAPAALAACPNEAFRVGPGAHLPECRAYEQVSPPDKNDGDVTYGPEGASANPLTASPIAPSGNLVSFSSFSSFAGNPAAQLVNQYLSRRGPTGWSTAGISPPRTAPYSGVSVDTRSTFVGFSRDLARMAVVGWLAPGQFSLMRRDSDGSFDLVADGAPSGQPLFAGASADFSRIVYRALEGAVFVWSGGVSTPISILPGETTPVSADPGEEIGPFGPGWGRLVSDDGERIYWKPYNIPFQNGIFLYENGASTEITLSQCTTGKVGEPGPGGNCPPLPPGTGSATFHTASRDGSLALFTSFHELTNDATTGSGGKGSDLYRYDADTGLLTDLAPDPADPNGAEVVGVMGASDDLSHVYFVANGVLAPGATAPTTPCVAFGSGARTCNLYLWHDGAISFVAGLSQADAASWGPRTTPKVHSTLTQTSADGRHLLFTTTTPTSEVIPGSTYDNAGHREAYLFDADAGEVTCISCAPGGGPSSHNAELGQAQNANPNAFALYENMTADGSRVFFETEAALLPRDTNGVRDVYEWQAAESGDCASAAQNGGCLYLVSTGRANGPSFFQNTTPSGDDVLVSTRQRLVGQDTDQLVDLYDARVGGGLASQYSPSASPPCLGETCRPPSVGPPAPPQPGSSGFAGPGNRQPSSAHKRNRTCHGKKTRKPRGQKAKKAHSKKAKKARGKKAISSRKAKAKPGKKAKGTCVRKPHRSAKHPSTGKRG